jgi:probable O-glycosylation ligase (exosortase A-associated)
MRDLILTAFILGTIPFILRNPFVGLLMWVWLGIMNPHRLTWGFAQGMPFAQIVAICTLVSMVVHTAKLYPFPRDRVAITLVFFVLWLCISPLTSFHPELEFKYWDRVIKIQVMGLAALMLVGNRDQLHKLTWVLALSIGYYGIKGGLFTIVTGGHFRVWGPPHSFIADNNQLALAIVMTVPLFRYLQLHSVNRWVKRGCLAAVVLCAAAAIGSQSRGAFLALSAMAFFLWTKSRRKGLVGVLVLAAVPIAWLLMPESWTQRMGTIQSYDQDGSAMGRINSWWMAWNLALDRFPIGGGFAIYERDIFLRYAPDPNTVLVAHSIYFQVLGEHGFLGLALFLAVFGFTWVNGAWIVRNTKDKAGLEWARDLAAMSQVSLIGYAVGGAFLSLTYFDLPYYIVVMMIVLRGLVKRELAAPAAAPVAAKAVPA